MLCLIFLNFFKVPRAAIFLGLILSISNNVYANEARSGAGLLRNYAEGMPFYYRGNELEKNWPRLHHRNSIDFPSESYVTGFYTMFPKQDEGDKQEIAMKLQHSWRLFHAGQFKSAYKVVENLGLIGLLPRLRILAIHHHFYIEDKVLRRNAFKALIREVERIQNQFEYEIPALYLLKAFCIGRYGQDINPISAFAKGLGGKLKKNIDRAAELAPSNIEAMMFKAVFHAEVISYIGNMTGHLLYGASREKSLMYFNQAMSGDKLNSTVLLEYGKACLKICKDENKQHGMDMLIALTKIKPIDIVDIKNIQLAKTLLKKMI